MSDPRWARRHWQTTRARVRRAPHFDEVRRRCSRRCTRRRRRAERLSDVNRRFLEALCALLGIATAITWSTDYATSRDASRSGCSSSAAPRARPRISRALRRATTWTNRSSGATGSTSRASTTRATRSTTQIHPPFEHEVTVLDLLFHVGSEAPSYLKSFAAARREPLRRHRSRGRALLLRQGRASTARLARGVDWNGEESQRLRFEQLLRVHSGRGPVLDQRLRLRLRRARRRTSRGGGRDFATAASTSRRRWSSVRRPPSRLRSVRFVSDEARAPAGGLHRRERHLQRQAGDRRRRRGRSTRVDDDPARSRAAQHVAGSRSTC